MYRVINTSFSQSILKTNADGTITSFMTDPANTDYAQFKKDILDGAELQDADGNVIDGIAYLEGLA